MLISLKNSLPFYIIKHKKISDLIKSKDILTEIHFIGAVADIFNWFFVLFQENEPLLPWLHLKCVLLVFAIMGKFVEWELYAELAAKELPGTRIARYNQLYKKDLLDKNCESAFDVLFSEHESNILNRARSFYEASLRYLIKKFPLGSNIFRCCKVVHLCEIFNT